MLVTWGHVLPSPFVLTALPHVCFIFTSRSYQAMDDVVVGRCTKSQESN